MTKTTDYPSPFHFPCRSIKCSIFLVIISSLLLTLSASCVFGAELGKQTYLLGIRGPHAGKLPPPGLYAANLVFIYNGIAAPNLEIPGDGNLTLGQTVTVIADAPQVIWSPDAKVFCGQLTFFGFVPLGYVNTSVDAKLTSPGGPPIVGASLKDSRFSIGDPHIGGLIGWSAGSFAWNTGFEVNIPIGDYKIGVLDNFAFNRWSVTVSEAVTWLDPCKKLEFSTVAGFTINGNNPDTDYRTGTEFQLEFAALYHMNKSFHAGLVGYHYQQVTGDSGTGAVLGGFKGRVTALGPHAAKTLEICGTHVTISARVFFEFNADNRLKATVGFLNVTAPLYTSSH